MIIISESATTAATTSTVFPVKPLCCSLQIMQGKKKPQICHVVTEIGSDFVRQGAEYLTVLSIFVLFFKGEREHL